VARIVLVADDSPTIQKKAVGILKGEGFEVETVSNGVAAIKRLAALHPVVILADVSMPGRDGYEVCDFVKKSAEHSHVPVLLVASDMEPYDEARGAHVKADGIIKKPFDPQDLISHVVKFANASEAAAPTVAMRVVAPAAAPPPVAEPAPEFAISTETPEETPSAAQPVAPDFSAASEGVAFAEPPGEEAPAYPPEPQPAAMEAMYPEAPPAYPPEPQPAAVEAVYPEAPPAYPPEPQPAAVEAMYPEAPQAEAEIVLEVSAEPELVETIPAPEPPSTPAAETPMVVEEELPAPSPPPPPPPPAERVPSYLEGLEAVSKEPVFIEEQPATAAAPSPEGEEVHTMIFRAPLQIAEPVWKDETVPAPPAPEPAAAAPEPPREAETPAAPPETPPAPPPEPPHFAPAVAATSLDSFSLDDATAGQVRFASEGVDIAPAEVAHAAPAEEVPTTETARLELAPQTVSPEPPSPEPAPGAAPSEPPAEAAPPPPAYDWGLIYTVVHKVVVKMSPPALPTEVVEDMARRLADEIAAEISAETPPSQIQ
jgi:CheY-like chemotaxis protein